MNHGPITIGGLPLPSDAPLFLALVGVHVAAGLTCVTTGLVAMLSVKRAGRHPRFGTYYYRSLWVVFITMAVLSALRWAEDYHLFILGTLSFASAFVGRHLAPSRSNGRIRIHVISMGLSYILLLTAFYVDNGKNLPLWRSRCCVQLVLMGGARSNQSLEGDRERPACPRRGRGRDCAPAALDWALPGGPSTSSLDST
jgi:hypothetical protein